MSSQPSSPATLSLSRRALRLIGQLTTLVIVAALAATLTAQALRDRNLWLTLLMYVPIWPIALAAVARDVMARGRALPYRWLLLAIGIAVGIFSVSLMWCPAREPERSAKEGRFTFAHWNVQWGGPRGLDSMTESLSLLKAEKPDVICLSEAPHGAQLAQALRTTGASVHVATVEHGPESPFWFRFAVMSPHEVVVRQKWALHAGYAALFEVALKPRPLRLLMVDIQSAPVVPRTPSIEEVARLVDDFAAKRMPVDIVAGDFNTPSRLRGFDALSAAGKGYRRAALWSGQWRATWPSGIPFSSFDIDHVWVAAEMPILGARLFSSRSSDHRGHLVWLGASRHQATFDSR